MAVEIYDIDAVKSQLGEVLDEFIVDVRSVPLPVCSVRCEVCGVWCEVCMCGVCGVCVCVCVQPTPAQVTGERCDKAGQTETQRPDERTGVCVCSTYVCEWLLCVCVTAERAGESGSLSAKQSSQTG